MQIPNLSRELIQERTAGGSFERGQQYLADGAVRSLERHDKRTIKAQVQGSDVHPYLVSIKHDNEGIQKVQCSCPYHEGSWCKHIVAALLKTLKQDSVPDTQVGQVEALVEDLNREELVALLESLVERNPTLIDDIQALQSSLST